MKVFVILGSIVALMIVGLQAAAVEPLVEELKKDDATSKEAEVATSPLNINEDCYQPKETGRCFALFYRFAFDVEKRECVEFIYGGCAGNSNNFETKEDCERKCTKNVDTAGEDKSVVATTTIAGLDDENEKKEEQVIAS